jgi:hypothetical protein
MSTHWSHSFPDFDPNRAAKWYDCAVQFCLRIREPEKWRGELVSWRFRQWVKDYKNEQQKHPWDPPER